MRSTKHETQLDSLVPKLCLGTHCPEAPLRPQSDDVTLKQVVAVVGVDLNGDVFGCSSEAELRWLAFPSGAWERGNRSAVQHVC